ncbi:response regulator, partial [Zavarzinia sp.]|uniref:response regulator n=1 Tax=Zavarzinia sp. TaxID=2027920 RepID=UPI003BB5DE3F
GLNRAEAAAALGTGVEAIDDLLATAREELARQAPARVLVIEDEPVIALHIAEIVREAGHEVVGIATRKSEAVALAAEHRPSLVLADIQLDDGSTGIEAAQEILQSLDVPVIFVTAFPERLLTGERMEPTYLVAKPFEPQTLVVTIAQALFHHPVT